MKKIVGVVIVLLVVAGCSAPFVNGLLAERQFRAILTKCNSMYADATLGAKLKSSGTTGLCFFCGEVEIQSGTAFSPLWRPGSGFTDHFKHGFTGVTGTTSLMDNPKYAEFVTTIWAGKIRCTLPRVTSPWGTVTSQPSSTLFPSKSMRKPCR